MEKDSTFWFPFRMLELILSSTTLMEEGFKDWKHVSDGWNHIDTVEKCPENKRKHK